MERPSRSSPRRREIYIKRNSCPLGFVVGFSIGATILVAYYSRFINFMDPCSSVI
jgi:hypothetical protein